MTISATSQRLAKPKKRTKEYTYKYCPQCQESKVPQQFYANDTWCRSCRKEHSNTAYVPLFPEEKYERRRLQRQAQLESAIAEENNVREKIARMQVYIAEALASPNSTFTTKGDRKRQRLVEQDGHWIWI